MVLRAPLNDMSIIMQDAGSDINKTLVARLEERMRATGLNPTSVGLQAGLSASTIRNIFEGKSKHPRSDTLAAVAKVLGTTPSYLMGEDEGEASRSSPGIYRPPPDLMNVSRPMPVYASAEGGQGHLIIDIHPIDHVPRPYTLEGIDDAYGILITGESMVPAYKPGDIAWVNPRLPPQRDTECILYRVDDGNGEAMATIKNLVGWTDKDWQLEQYNPAKRFPLPRREWTKHHRVVGNFRRR